MTNEESDLNKVVFISWQMILVFLFIWIVFSAREMALKYEMVLKRLNYLEDGMAPACPEPETIYSERDFD